MSLSNQKQILLFFRQTLETFFNFVVFSFNFGTDTGSLVHAESDTSQERQNGIWLS